MATTISSHSKNHHKPTIAIIFRRRRFKETTISTTATTTHHHHHPSAVSPENTSSGWCCPPAVPSHKHPPPPSPSPPPVAGATINTNPSSISPSPESVPTQKEKIPHFDPPVNLGRTQMAPMMTTAAVYGGAGGNQECFTSFNSALAAGILNPASPPPPPPGERTRSSPTLFEMMANEPDSAIPNTNGVLVKRSGNGGLPAAVAVGDRRASMQERLSDMLSCRSPGNRFNDPNSSDVRLSLRAKDGLSVCVDVHRQILVANSRYFAVELSDIRRRLGENVVDPYVVEIGDCDDIEVYVECIKLMYSKDLKRRLMKEDVPRVLGILKVSAAIGFNAGVLSCLEYLEAAPWAEDEEEKVASLLSELRLEGVGAVEVLKRVSVDVTPGDNEINDNQDVLLKLLHVVLEGKDEKARREMKVLVSKMLHENSSKNDLRKESLYSACDKCLDSLRYHFLKASEGDFQEAAQITRQSGNLHWLLDILIDRQISEDFLKLWASQTELSEVHSKVPALHRYEISRVSARLFVGIGKGQLLASKDSRCLLLQTWLVPFYDDFTWMRRGSRGLDRHLIEEGLSNTILTLPLAWQQEIFMAWFDRFLNSGDDCPNIQRGFEVWWKRAFWKKPESPFPTNS